MFPPNSPLLKVLMISLEPTLNVMSFCLHVLNWSIMTARKRMDSAIWLIAKQAQWTINSGSALQGHKVGLTASLVIRLIDLLLVFASQKLVQQNSKSWLWMSEASSKVIGICGILLPPTTQMSWSLQKPSWLNRTSLEPGWNTFLFKVLMMSLEAMLCLSVTMFSIEAYWQPESIWIWLSGWWHSRQDELVALP